MPTGIVAQVRPQHSVQFSIAAKSKGLELSYEYRPDLAKRMFGFKGFVGHGFQASSGGTWTLSTHYDRYRDDSRERELIAAPDHDEYSFGGEVNMLLGGRRHAAEVALGMALDYFSTPLNFYSQRKELGTHPSSEALEKAKPSQWASHSYLRTGYRYTHRQGITAGIGINFLQLQGPFTYFYASTTTWMPYITLGYSF